MLANVYLPAHPPRRNHAFVAIILSLSAGSALEY